MDFKKYRKADIAELLLHAGYKLEKHDSHGQFKVVGLGGLIIQPATGLFNHFSEGIGGKGAIDLIMHLQKCTFREAIEYIDQCMGGNLTLHTYTYQEKRTLKKPFSLPAANNTHDKVIAYLTEERKISKDFIHHLISADLLYESAKHHNCVFVCHDFSGKATGAVLRGTYNPKSGEPFKGLAPNTDGLYGMNLSKYTDCQSKQLYVFEAPIDMLSYIQMYGCKLETATYLAMSGLKPNMVMNYIQKIKELEKIVICTDNDVTGNRFAEEIIKNIQNRFSNLLTERIRPKKKDWNEDLVDLSQF